MRVFLKGLVRVKYLSLFLKQNVKKDIPGVIVLSLNQKTQHEKGCLCGTQYTTFSRIRDQQITGDFQYRLKRPENLENVNTSMSAETARLPKDILRDNFDLSTGKSLRAGK